MISFILQVRKKVNVVKHFLFYYDFNSCFSHCQTLQTLT